MIIPRTDLSPYLVHLTRDGVGETAREKLINIIRTGVLEARNPHGIARAHLRWKKWDTPEWMDSQRAVCFSATPLAEIPALLNPGIWRGVHLKPYGVVFERKWLINRDGAPVWYLPQYKTQRGEWLVHDVNKLIDEAATKNGVPDPNVFAESSIARLTPFMEAVGVWETERGTERRKEFDFEREWRVVGNLRFALPDIHALLTDVNDRDKLRRDLAPWIGMKAAREIRIIEVGEANAEAA